MPARSASLKLSAPDRQDHELLDVERVVGMRAAIDDVHHRRRQHPGADAAEIAVERQADADGGGLGGGEADGQDRVGAEPLLVLGAVELDHRRVERGLVERVEAGDRVGDLAVDRVDRPGDALAEIAALVAVAQLDRLARAGRGAGRHGGPAEGAAVQDDVGLDGRVAAAVQDLAAADRDDLVLAHDVSSRCAWRPLECYRRLGSWPARRTAADRPAAPPCGPAAPCSGRRWARAPAARASR